MDASAIWEKMVAYPRTKILQPILPQIKIRASTTVNWEIFVVKNNLWMAKN